MTRESTIHFVFGGAAVGTLVHFLGDENNVEVTEVRDPLAFGPLYDYGTSEGNAIRGKWLQTVYYLIGDADGWQWISDDVGLPSLSVDRDKSDNNYIVWIGQSVDEQLMLRAICALLPEQQLLIADVTKGKLGDMTVPIVGACSPEELATVKLEPLDTLEHRALAEEWNKLTETSSMVRLWDGDEIQTVDEEFFDHSLLAIIKTGPHNAAKVIGQILGQYTGQVGDTFLSYRISVLMQQGVVCSNNTGSIFKLNLT